VQFGTMRYAYHKLHLNEATFDVGVAAFWVSVWANNWYCDL
jgi:hypothetical protein